MIDEKKLIEDIEKEIEFAMKCNMPTMVAGMRQIASVIEKQPKICEWIQCSERLPDKDGSYLTQNDFGGIRCLDYADGWNCIRDYLSGEIYREYELHSVVAWMPLPKAYEGETENVD